MDWGFNTGARTGERGAGVLGDLHRYDPFHGEWGELGRASLLGEAPSARNRHGMVAAAGGIYVFGGERDDGIVLYQIDRSYICYISYQWTRNEGSFRIILQLKYICCIEPT
jgi:hypothetical protein